MKKLVLAAAALCLLLLPRSAATEEGATVLDGLTQGKAAMEKKCKFCHSLSRTLS